MNEEDNKKEENVKETKIDILKSILSEVSIFKNKITSLESSLYKKEQTDEAAAAEAFLETESDKEAIKVDKEGLPIEEPEKEEEGGFFSFLSGAIGFIAILTPIILKNIDVIKDVFKGLPDLFGSSLKEIMFSVFEKIQTALTKSVYEPIQKYLTDTVGQLWRSLVLSVEETFVGVIGSLPTFLKDNLPDVIKGLTESAAEDIANGGKPGKEPEVELTVGSSGSFGATENAQFGGEYKPQEYGTPVAPPAPKPPVITTTETTAAGTPTTPSAPTVLESEAVPSVLSSIGTSEAVSAPSAQISGDGEKVSAPQKMQDAKQLPRRGVAVSPGTAVSGVPGEIVKIVEVGPGYNVVQMSDGKIQRREGNRNWRNNNPGNISYGDFAKGKGAIGTDGRFAIFPTYEMGRQAKIDLIFKGSGYKDLDLKSAIFRYAPPSENNSERYYQTVLSAVGGVDKTMGEYTPNEQIAIVNAMQKVEGFVIGSVDIVGETEPTTMLASTPEQKMETQAIPETGTAQASLAPSPIAAATQELKTVAEKQEEEQQQVVIQTVAQSQTPQVVPDRKPASSKKPAPPADLIQRSYASYFAVA